MTVERILSKNENSILYNSFCKLAYRKKTFEEILFMKNTVKLEQFVALKEKDLQKIQGGEMRKPDGALFNLFRRR